MAVIDKFSQLAALRPAKGAVVCEDRQRLEAAPLDEHQGVLARAIGATLARTKFGTHLSVRNWHATPELPEVSATALDLLCHTADVERSKKWRAAADDPEKWLFMDTETTGLAGGTGTYAFLVGIAWWDAGGLQVEQFVMRDFSDEYSILLELAARIAERPVLLTFNGKTFDWPLLESRFLMTRSIRVPQLAAHLDLLHPARAVWKLRLGSVRLVDLERDVLDATHLGWDRQDDVPGSLIPQYYFDYLRGGSPGPLAGVVRHNRMDLRGLAALFGKLNSLLGAAEHKETHPLDLFGLSRYLQRRGERIRAESTCVAARDRGLPLPLDAQAQRGLAQMAKRRREYEKSAEIWKELLLDDSCRAMACEELAAYHERRSKNFEKAMEFARLGMKELRKPSAGMSNLSSPAGRPASQLRRMERLEKRVARLTTKLNAIAPESAVPLLKLGRRVAAGK
jgi:uncharacterized protein YprB with RNaseH-like and TPR domain